MKPFHPRRCQFVASPIRAIALLLSLWLPTLAAEPPEKAQRAEWTSLFDGQSLGKWKVLDRYDYLRHGKVHVDDGRIVLEAGRPGTGLRWTGDFPTMNYEVTLEAMRVEHEDFFCGLTFPVGDDPLTLIVGGWGGRVTGLSCIDGEPAVENETCGYEEFKSNRWYRIRLRVTPSKVEAWIDKQQIVDFDHKDHKLSVYWEVDLCRPFGVATWNTTGALRDIRVRRLAVEPDEPDERETPDR